MDSIVTLLQIHGRNCFTDINTGIILLNCNGYYVVINTLIYYVVINILLSFIYRCEEIGYFIKQLKIHGIDSYIVIYTYIRLFDR